MDLIKAPEVAIWQAVVVQAVRDALANNKSQYCGVEHIYKWSKSYDCKEVCFYAQLNHRNVRIGFIKIYLKYLTEEIQKTNEFILTSDIFVNNKLVNESIENLKELKIKRQKSKERWEKIKWKKM